MVNSFYISGTRPFPVKGRAKKTRLSLLLYLVIFAVIQLNFQKVLYDLLGVPLDSGASHPILLLWAFMLLIVLAFSAARLFSLVRLRRVEAWAVLFLVVCASHGLIIGATSGLTVGIFSFLAWGIGVGVFFQVGRDASCDGPRFVIFILVFSGMLQAVPTLWESVMGVTIFKQVTIANLTRLYGISQSVSILGIQLAVGIIASIYLLFTSKNKLLISIIIVIQLWALIASTSRGPFIYMMFVLYIISLLLPSTTEKKIIWALLVAALVSFAILLALGFSTQSSAAIQQSFLLEALNFDDTGNSERLRYYGGALEVLFSSFPTLILGHGSGMLSIIQARSGGYEFGVESSFLKIFLELGVLGAIPFFAVIVVSLRTALANWKRKRDMSSLFLFACLLVVVMQMTTHELMKAWIGGVYLWMIAGGILHTRVFPRDYQRSNMAAE